MKSKSSSGTIYSQWQNFKDKRNSLQHTRFVNYFPLSSGASVTIKKANETVR